MICYGRWIRLHWVGILWVVLIHGLGKAKRDLYVFAFISVVLYVS